MASSARKPLPPVIAELLEHPEEYSFFQIVQLLAAYSRQEFGQNTSQFLRDSFRVRPDLSLAFPPADIIECDIETKPPLGFDSEDELASLHGEAKIQGDTFHLTATFLGLYGTGSPLPTFYTEELMADASEDSSVAREFLDFIGQPFFSLLYKGWMKYRLMHQIDVENNVEYLNRLYSLIGLGHHSFRKKLTVHRKALRYIGLLSQFPRSARGLEDMLADFLGIDTVYVEQCVRREVTIPVAQRSYLGEMNQVLGASLLMGSQITDRMGKITIHITHLDITRFAELHPHGDLYEELRQLIQLYLTEPLEYDVKFCVLPKNVKTTRLGGRSWGSLGWDTWLFAGNIQSEPVAHIAMSQLGPEGAMSKEARAIIFPHN